MYCKSLLQRYQLTTKLETVLVGMKIELGRSYPVILRLFCKLIIKLNAKVAARCGAFSRYRHLVESEDSASNDQTPYFQSMMQ